MFVIARRLVPDTNRDDVYIVSGYTSSKNPAINSMQSILQHSHVMAGWVWRVLALVMLPVSVALAADSIDLSLEKARTLVQQGQFAEALPLLRALPLDGSDQYDILFLIGLASMELAVRTSDTTGRRDDLLEQAIFAFRAMLIYQPGLVRVRLELARSYFLKGDDDRAKEHFERVLADKELPRAVALNVLGFLKQIQSRRRWSVYRGFSLAPDSNINAASNEETVYLYGLPFRRDAEFLARSGTGVSLWGGGEYQHPINSQWRVRVGADLFLQEYSGSRFDQSIVSTHVGPRWLIDGATEASLLAVARQRWVGTDPYSNDLGMRFEIRHRLTRNWLVKGRSSWYRRHYKQSDFLNGTLLDFTGNVSWLATSNLRVDAKLGYTRDRPGLERQQSDTPWGALGASVALPQGYTVGGEFAFYRARHKADWSTLTQGDRIRRDQTEIWRLSLQNRSWTLWGMSPKLILAREGRNSNAQTYDYQRERVELQFVEQF